MFLNSLLTANNCHSVIYFYVMSTEIKKSLGEIIKDDMKLKGINGSAVARKMNVARQVINQIDRRKKFDLEFLIDFKKASGLDYTKYAYENVVGLLQEEEPFHQRNNNNVTLNFTLSCHRDRVSQFSAFLDDVDAVAKKYGYQII
jgi:transcriptional regulator with XRE-family HTH domain